LRRPRSHPCPSVARCLCNAGATPARRVNPWRLPSRLKGGEEVYPPFRKGIAMRRTLFAVLALLAGLAPAQAAGLLIPEEKNLPPLAMLEHKVTIAIEDQVA